MKISIDASVLWITRVGIQNFMSLIEFDKTSVDSLPKICKETIPAITADAANGITVENGVTGANISSISVCCLILAVNATE